MRLLTCAAALATATLFASSLATPTQTTSYSRGDTVDDLTEFEEDEEYSDTKYFNEPGGSIELGHYDERYLVENEERRDTQSHMVRAYLHFFRENELDTWIAHGTLLGWWWNGKRLPWDYDVGTQVSDSTLHHLGAVHNQTRYQYTSYDGTVQREYLLDVNPWIWERELGNGQNIIDARWIDLRNGLFIDITGLSETDPENYPGQWSCKNYHLYDTAELYPMRETMFEGVPAKIPYNYDKILVDEYKEEALLKTEFHGHRWDPEFREWVKTPETLAKEAERKKKKKFETKKKVSKEYKLD